MISFKRLLRFFMISLILSQITMPWSVMAHPTDNTIRVAVTGTDAPDCGSEVSPCRNLQYAVNKSLSGDTILVAGGTYTYSGGNPSASCTYLSITNAVVCVNNKHLTILGGYSTSNWMKDDPLANLTLIDGQNSFRGIVVIDDSSEGNTASLTLEGFTIQNGKAQGEKDSNSDLIGAYGGGMFVHIAPVILRNIIFINNVSQGGDATSIDGGPGAGGGLTLNRIPTTSKSTLEHIIFMGNKARGGNTTDGKRGGAGVGGGMFGYSVSVEATYLTFIDNQALGGSSVGSGVGNDGQTADGLGGGIALHRSGTISLQYITATGNQAIGGNAGTQAGHGLGGFLESEITTQLSLSNALAKDNLASGGSGLIGGIGGGGGIMVSDASIWVERSSILANTAKGGNGGGTEIGSAGGGGLYINRYSKGITTSIANCIIADNYIEMGDGTGTVPGGGGGGLWLIGSVDITHSTIARNRMEPRLVYGIGVIILNFGTTEPTIVDISYSTISDHINNYFDTWPIQDAVHVWSTTTLNLNRNAFINNTDNTNSDNQPPSFGGPGTINGYETSIFPASSSYISSGSPNYNYHISQASTLKDQATGSTTTLVDVDGQSRPYNIVSDIGADEYVPFSLLVFPGNRSLRLDWAKDAGLLAGGVSHYEVLVTCPAGANPPAEGGCGVPIHVGMTTSFTLTGLSNFKQYTILIYANRANDDIVATSVEITAFPTNHFVYMPFVTR